MDFHVNEFVKIILAARQNNVSGRDIKWMISRLQICLDEHEMNGLKPQTKVFK